ncbi:GGDEF domain-containing protein [Longispora sp. NPDC051575]|uniref:GGDEF domain-containing protein n=1 Tax=Longispora sp. NPDC051575 TaxID=3154943 RepID=UPI0034379078
MAVPVADPGRRWTSGWWGDWRLAALALGVLALTGWYVTDSAGLPAQNRVCWLALLVLHGWALALAPRIARRAVPPGHRRLWWVATAALACFLLGDVVQLAAILTGPTTIATVTGVPGQAVLVTAGVVIFLLGMLATPLGLATPGERLRHWFDLATVMAAGLAWGFYLVARPTLDMRSATGLVGTPVLFLVELFATTRLVFSRVPPFTRAAGTLSVGAAVLETSIQATGGLAWVENDRLNLLLAATVVANALVTAAVVVQFHQLPSVVDRRGQSHRRRFSLLPYAAIASVYVVLVLTLVRNGLDLRAWAAVAGAFLCTLLVVVRQVLAFRDNERLVHELSAEVGRRQRLAAALRHQAYHDRLTGLGNRALFTEFLTEAVARGGTAVVIVDLDDFKPVNDRFGHRAGDELLVTIAARLRRCVRDTDVLARLGGDEFGVVVTDPDPVVVAAIAERIVAAVAVPCPVAGARVVVGASVGAAIDRAGRQDADALLHAADSAMYAAKKEGKNSARVVTLDEPGTPAGLRARDT